MRERETHERGRRPRAARSALAAVSFLTRLPMDRNGSIRPADIERGVMAFPIVGAGIGGIVAASAWATGRMFPAAVAAVFAVAVELVLTGALHVDGLADTADGYGGRSREHSLEIMRDHAIGAYGVAAIAVDVAMKIVAITALAGFAGGLWALIAAGSLSRGAAAGVGTLVPYARAKRGTGGILGQQVRLARVAGTVLLAAAIAWLAIGVRGLVAAAVVAVLCVIWAWRCRVRLGGMTGDTLGATVEATELLVLLVALAMR